MLVIGIRFLKNKFPVEAVLVYSGKDAISSEFVVTKKGSVVYRETISFSQINNTNTVTFALPAQSVGLQDYTAAITPLWLKKTR